MGLIQKLQEANLDSDTRIELRSEHGEDVVHAWDGYESEVISNSDLVSDLTELALHPSNRNTYILDDLRNDGLLDDYERGSYEFEEYVHDTIMEEYHNYGWVETETEQYDYKRGFCTAYVQYNTTVGKLMENLSDFDWGNWTAEVDTDLGTLKIDNY
jgi:hypothetical protein